jgi:DNA polymerase III epsilon subunit family exonuclease
MDSPLVILDTETATLRGAPHLLELGAIRVVQGEVQGEFQSLVRPEVPIDPEATSYHGISADDVAGAPPAAEVLARFSEWLGGDWMVAHDAPADARVLGFEFARAQLAPPAAPLIDSLRLARRLIPEAENHRLETLCNLLGLEEGVRHRALADAVWCWKVVEECAHRLGSTATLPALLAEAGASVSIASSSPRLRGKLKPRLRALQRACGERSPVTLVYSANAAEDAQPVPLPVLPHLLFELGEKSYLEAQCRSSGLLKTYRLDRIHRIL